MIVVEVRSTAFIQEDENNPSYLVEAQYEAIPRCEFSACLWALVTER